ncbi:hypothetical protein LCGC14_1962860 [marine sediment metagenome]|uniref:Uncharacterized protein n=1 Tax=marine sediment metagenome TaxID=412755 RepID=A0A0F9FE00_9ZZZZ
MINPTKADIGRSVVYLPKHGEEEAGLITSFNQSVVFVRYRYDKSEQTIATYRKDLVWASDFNTLTPIHPLKGY